MHYNVYIYISLYISLDWGYTMILKECHLDRTQSHNFKELSASGSLRQNHL